MNMAALMWARSRQSKLSPVSTLKVDLHHFLAERLLLIDGGVLVDYVWGSSCATRDGLLPFGRAAVFRHGSPS